MGSPTPPVLLKFHRGSAPYIAGDVAGFPREMADRYIQAGHAVEIQPHEVPPDPPRNPGTSAGEKLPIVRFLRPHVVGVVHYRAGEVAGFGQETVKFLESIAVAQEIDPSEVTAEENTPGNVLDLRKEPVVEHKAEDGIVYHTGGGAYIAPARPDLVSVRFVRGIHGYVPGDVAGFPSAKGLRDKGQFPQGTAESYLQTGHAVLHEAAEVDEPQAAAGGGNPNPESVDEDAEVLGLDDRDPDWREKAEEKGLDRPPADKMNRGEGKKGRR